MKGIPLFFLVIFVTGCATSYNSMIGLPAVGIQKVNNEDLLLSAGVQDLGDNNRFRSKAYEKQISFIKLSVEARRDCVIIDRIELLNETEDAVIPSLTASLAADQMNLHVWPYLFWGLLWFGYTRCENGECSGTWIPVGLIIGIINSIKAKETNSRFRKEITDHQFEPVRLKAGQTNEGLLFLQGRRMALHIRVKYRVGNSDVKFLTVPYSL